MSKNTVLITGAGKRIGLHLAQQFIAQGDDVIVHYHQQAEATLALEKQGVLCIHADFCDTASVQKLIEKIHGSTTKLRAIIHNASAFEKTAEQLPQALQQFEQFFRVHMLASYQISTALVPLLQASDTEHSDIVQISDIYADNPNPLFDLYCASKAGAQNLALSLAKRYAPKIKVNIVQPGPILFKEWHSAAVKQQVLDETLLKKEGGADAISLAVMAILNNPYQTGSVIAVDGGRRLT